MTFEEFLIKKKIDLAQFNTAEPGLFLEFQSHYSQMGEKSFDHSKKFLFNKLRRTYHLKEEPKPVVAKETIEINEIASQAEPLLSPTVEATVYTPRFRAGGTTTPAQPTEPEAAKNEKPAYTPRFKAAPPKSPEASPAEQNKVENAADKPKPAYVPRFKAPAPIKETPQPDQPASDLSPQTSSENTPEPKPAEEKKEQTPAKPKPAYVPRFKASATPKPAEEKKDEDSPDKT